jgi:hypothetical protein
MASTCCAGQGGQFDQIEDTWVVHLWLVNDNVSPPLYLHMPAIVDTRCEEQLLIPLRDAQKLQLAEDTLLAGRGIVDAVHNIIPVLTYKPVRVLVPMLNQLDGQLAFYMPGWLNCTSFGKVALPEKAHLPSAVAAAADQHVKEAGAQAIAMVGDKSEAWVQTSPTRHPRQKLNQEHALLGLKAMDELGLRLDREHCAFHTVKMRTVNRRNDAF